MKKSLYPSNRSDQFVFWMAWLSLLIFFALVYLYWFVLIDGRMPMTRVIVPLGPLMMAVYASYASYYQRSPSEDEGTAAGYTTVIAEISAIAGSLETLSEFLVREREKIENAEATVRRLNDERSALEPVVLTQREAVEAILSAHANRTAKNAWKERLIGFGIGVIASSLVSVVYGLFAH